MRRCAIHGGHSPVAHHLQRLRQRFRFIGNQRTGLRARNQTAVRHVSPIGKHLLPRGQPQPFSGTNKLTARQADQNQLRITVPHRTGNRRRQYRVFCRLVIEHTVRLHVTQYALPGANHRLQCASLVEHLSVDRLRRQVHRGAAKVIPVREARVSANRHAIFDGMTHALQHGLRIARVKAAGNIDRRDQRH